ncbi:hypothetical protein RGR602_PA00124 (plasmid) [Rhizobium gallicum bv. gallicum R602sp]|uniref:Uncharacterized protein n=1 Tax=Rhizobium gallicum bv. gallicum R602sp TaxID=1041138 RepID=A0A0B4X5X1_9HYPH|nr:hypothetical protein RGR602_PA00124 [Rhizobium gallicum bv. gallicum R602sp]
MDVSGERHLSGKSYAFTRGSLTRMAFVWPSTLARAASSSALAILAFHGRGPWNDNTVFQKLAHVSFLQ